MAALGNKIHETLSNCDEKKIKHNPTGYLVAVMTLLLLMTIAGIAKNQHS